MEKELSVFVGHAKYTAKKENQIFLIYKEIKVSSYMGKYLRIFLIY